MALRVHPLANEALRQFRRCTMKVASDDRFSIPSLCDVFITGRILVFIHLDPTHIASLIKSILQIPVRSGMVDVAGVGHLLTVIAGNLLESGVEFESRKTAICTYTIDLLVDQLLDLRLVEF